jgi:death-on-curing protein
MRYLSLGQVLYLHERIIDTSGGAPGLRDLGVIESSIAQPQATFDGDDLYSSLEEKAAALAYSLVSGHGFVDGNKRVGHAAMEVFLILNGFELEADTDEQSVSSLALHLERYHAQNW